VDICKHCTWKAGDKRKNSKATKTMETNKQHPDEQKHSIEEKYKTKDKVERDPTVKYLSDILKQFLPVLLPYITKMCTASLREGILTK